VKGKLSYLSPELTYGQPATPMTDLFAMGTVLWEALAGRRLFDAPTDIEVFKQIRACNVRPLEQVRPELPRELLDIVARSLAADPARRFPSARAMAVALAELLKTTRSIGDAQQQLGIAVREARERLRLKAVQAAAEARSQDSSLVIEVAPMAASQVTSPEAPRAVARGLQEGRKP
jgi:serine/threonine-protein kinase